MLVNYCRRALSRTAPRAVTASVGAMRYLNVQEYVSMDLMRSYGLPSPICYTATTPQEAEQLYYKLNPRKYLCCIGDTKACFWLGHRLSPIGPLCEHFLSNLTFLKLNSTANPKNSKEAAIMKAQVLTGGRGKGHFDNGFQGGVKFISSASQAARVAEKMLGANLITKQAPKGLPCHKVLLRECFDLERELYLSIILDRQAGGPLLVAR